MSPSILEGDYVLTVTNKLMQPRTGDCIVFKHPHLGFLIKKITCSRPHGFFVEGTHPESTSRDSIGLVTADMIVGKVIMRIPGSNTGREPDKHHKKPKQDIHGTKDLNRLFI